jgi:pyruvate formate lyase activating enzyme
VTRPREAIVFDVQRFSIHDGPGIRSVVFFKGCGLSCIWCQNPEAMRAAPELAYYEARCLEDCALCVDVCPEDAIRPQRSGRVDFGRCTACGKCALACPSSALRCIGRSLTAPELLEEVLRDRTFYQTSGGGVTFSGGEPLLHSAFLQELLRLVRVEGLHAAIETGGAYPFALLEPLLPHTDLVLFDVKLAHAQRHARYTGRENGEILDNLGRLLRTDVCVEVRMPVVPGFNTDDENIAATARLVSGLGVGRVTLLPYNHLWEAKLPNLGTSRGPLGVRPPDGDFYVRLQADFARHGLEARL